MKVYRIIPNTLSLNLGNHKDILGELNYQGFEDFYYRMGFVSFQKNENLERFTRRDSVYTNNFDFKKESKFFFFYPENAIMTAHQIIGQKKLSSCSYMLAEYDIPVDLLAENLGWGRYFEEQEYLEFLIPKEKLVTSPINITKTPSQKEEVFSKSFQDTIITLKQVLADDTTDFNTMDTFQLFFKYKKLLNNDDKKVQSTIQTSSLYRAFLENNQEVYESSYLTGNYFYVHDGDISRIINHDGIYEIFDKKGFFISEDCRKKSKTEEKELLKDLIDSSFDTRKNILMKVRRN